MVRIDVPWLLVVELESAEGGIWAEDCIPPRSPRRHKDRIWFLSLIPAVPSSTAGVSGTHFSIYSCLAAWEICKALFKLEDSFTSYFAAPSMLFNQPLCS
jgi:hypothetical protein